MGKHKQTKACDITDKVRRAVWERDGDKCIFCGRAYCLQVMHYVSRAQGGLGIEQNLALGCVECHRAYDGIEREWMKAVFAGHLSDHYDNWGDTKLIYNKWEGLGC